MQELQLQVRLDDKEEENRQMMTQYCTSMNSVIMGTKFQKTAHKKCTCKKVTLNLRFLLSSHYALSLHISHVYRKAILGVSSLQYDYTTYCGLRLNI